MTESTGSAEVTVTFISAESAINMLEGTAVVATTLDGVEAIGILERFIPLDGTRTMVKIVDIISDDLILGTDIRNFKEIVVP
jgi:hypothetical protein